jgi:phosphoribosyl-ATP pyrophosphohydrolase
MAKLTKKKRPEKSPSREAKLRAMPKKAIQRMQAAEMSRPPPPLGPSAAVLDRIWTVVTNRRDADSAVSHSARLLSRAGRRLCRNSASKPSSA